MAFILALQAVFLCLLEPCWCSHPKALPLQRRGCPLLALGQHAHFNVAQLLMVESIVFIGMLAIVAYCFACYGQYCLLLS